MMLFNKKEGISEEENKIVNEIKALTIDIINAKNNGNLDFSLDLVETLYTLYSKHLNIDPSNINYLNRDRLILSTPTAYPAMLATLYMSGYDISIDSLKDKNNDKVFAPGVDVIFDKFGSGLATSLGITIGEEYLNNTLKNGLFDYYTYVIISDLDLLKGLSYSTLSLAGTLKLKKMIIFYDNNKEALGNIEKDTFDIDTNKLFESFNFNIINVNKYDVVEIDNAIKKAKDSDRPTVIVLNQDNDKYKFENNYIDHKYQLSDEEIRKIKEGLEVRNIPFAVSNETKENMENMIQERVKDKIKNYNNILESLDEDKKEIINKLINKDLSLKNDINYSLDEEDLPEDIIIKILKNLLENNELFIGGLENFDTNINDKFNDIANFKNNNKTGKLINYGIRENIIAEVQNGLSLSYLRNFSISSLKSANKLIPAIIKASYLKLNNIYILVNDCDSYIDGIDSNIYNNINSLRNIDNLDVYRPNDANEIIGTMKLAIASKETPSCIIIDRNNITTKENSSIIDVKKGAYIIKNENKNADCILISSGVDLDYTLEISNNLTEKGYDIRVISIPCTSLFDKQKADYKNELLSSDKIFVIENSSSHYWYKYIKEDGHIFTFDKVDWSKDKIEELKEKIIENIENIIK